MGIHEKLIKVQIELKAPKNQRNNFGNYNYRNCEDILEAVKPLLEANNLLLNLSDEILLIGDRFYVKSTATVSDENGEVRQSFGMAREEESKKGMDGSQITGSSSSYARKYALNGLFLIDDTKDSDFTNQGQGDSKDKTQQQTKPLSEAQIKRMYAISNKAGYDNNKLVSMVLKKYNKPIEQLTKQEYDYICNSLEEGKR